MVCAVALAAVGCNGDPGDRSRDVDDRHQLLPAPPSELGQQEQEEPPPSKPAVPQAKPQAQSQAAPQADPPAQPPAAVAPGLKLVAAGAGPTRELRYAFEPGELGQVTIDVNLSMPNPSGRGPKALVMPTLRFVLALEGETLPDGGYRVSFKTTDVDVLARKGAIEQLTEHLRPSMQKAKSFAGSVELDDRGIARQVDVPEAPDAQREIKQPFDLLLGVVRQLVPPLPVEPVGGGASWTVSRTIKTFELSTDEQVTYTLKKITKQGGRLDLAVVRSADAQPWTAPTRNAGQVVAYSYTATGTRDFDFSSPVPVVQMSSKSSRTLKSAGGGQPQEMPIEVDLTVGPSKP